MALNLGAALNLLGDLKPVTETFPASVSSIVKQE